MRDALRGVLGNGFPTYMRSRVKATLSPPSPTFYKQKNNNKRIHRLQLGFRGPNIVALSIKMATNIRGPGILYVNSWISRPDLLTEETYFHWYDTDHIPDILSSGGIKTAYRYIDVNTESRKPYFAFYPMEDMAFMLGPEFKKIRVKSDLLPGTGICYDMADVDVRYYGLTSTHGSRKGKV